MCCREGGMHTAGRHQPKQCQAKQSCLYKSGWLMWRWRGGVKRQGWERSRACNRSSKRKRETYSPPCLRKYASITAPGTNQMCR
eukprot:COSAG02_NODE_422_length_22587_cov_10.209089_13_plen_84_part_00